ncbi:MAG TPA: HDOD domain-containing protein [Telluria sp.]|nr:HDOD domain-containing protein [Telluria sp.]
MGSLVLPDVVKSVRSLPALPALVADVIATMGDEDADIGALADKIALDLGLAAQVLRLANSSFYGLPTRVNTVGQAISVLGFHNLRNLVTVCAVTGNFKQDSTSGLHYATFWRHSIGTAVCARLLAGRVGVAEETAFLAGLLHDVGILALASVYPELYAQTRAHRRSADCLDIEAERAVLGIDHALVGSELMGHWRFPPAIREMVASHHDYNPAAAPLVGLIQGANALAVALDLAGDDDAQVPDLPQHVWDLLQLDEGASEALFDAAEKTCDELCNILVT